MFQKKQDAQNAARSIAIGAALAAAAGYLVGLLTAPKSGKETRQDIKDTATKSKTEAEKELKKLHTELSSLLNDVKGKVHKTKTDNAKDVVEDKEAADVLDKAKSAKEKARHLLSALHDGDAEDAELKQAIAEANKAIEHVRKFLKK